MISEQPFGAVEVVTHFTAALKTGDLEACRALVREDLVFSEAPSLPFGGDHTGWEAVVGMLGIIGREYRIRLDDPVIAAAGDRVLVRVSGSISSRATGRQMPLEAVDLYHVDDAGLITRVDVFYKDAAAVSALRTTESGAA
jgi:ketosteroid isomerase-like protein